MITANPTEESERALEAAFDRLEMMPKAVGENAWDIAFEVYSQAVRNIFRQEGPGWAPLKPYTISERIGLGYSPGPILVREGTLLASLTIPDLGPMMSEVRKLTSSGEEYTTPIRTGNLTEKKREGQNYRGSFATLDQRFLMLQEGGRIDAQIQVPARPMVPTTPMEKRLVCVEVETRLLRLLEGLVNG